MDHTVCVWGKQANTYLQQRITLQQKLRVLHSLSVHLRLCSQCTSVLSHSRLNSCLKNLRLNWKRQVLLLPLLSAPSIYIYILWYSGCSSCTNMHRYAGSILYKYKMNCCTCSDWFPILLPQLFQGIKTSANDICADWSKCWAMVTVRISKLVCFLFIQKVCHPL